jgi:CHAD domain-containing protein
MYAALPRKSVTMAPESSRNQALFSKLLRLARTSARVEPERVHQLRTTIRRVETIFATAGPAVGRKERKLLKQLARLRRRAGKIRDLDVQIEALQGLRLDSIARERARVMDVLRKGRTRREKKFLQSMESELELGLAKRLQRTQKRSAESPRGLPKQATEERWLNAALDQFEEVVKQYPTFSENNLHEFRMASKRVRYLAEMAGEGPKVAALIEPLKRIQASIGNWHDWVTLTGTAERILLRPGQVALLSALRAGTRSKYLEALRITADAKRTLLSLRVSQPKLPRPVSPQVTATSATAMAAGA